MSVLSRMRLAMPDALRLAGHQAATRRCPVPYPSRTRANNRPARPVPTRHISREGWNSNYRLSLSAEVARTREAATA